MVLLIGRAKVSLGRDMQSHRFCYRWRKEFAQILSTRLLMAIIDSIVRGIVGEMMQEMSNVVQQRRSNEWITVAVRLSEMRRLQCVFELGDAFTAILRIATLPKKTQ